MGKLTATFWYFGNVEANHRRPRRGGLSSYRESLSITNTPHIKKGENDYHRRGRRGALIQGGGLDRTKKTIAKAPLRRGENARESAGGGKGNHPGENRLPQQRETKATVKKNTPWSKKSLSNRDEHFSPRRRTNRIQTTEGSRMAKGGFQGMKQ